MQTYLISIQTLPNILLSESVTEFDAILFHIRDMNDGRILLPNQKRRKPNQRYVMFLMESPLNDNFPYEKFGKFFNWTMTFRRDSDFYRPYGWIGTVLDILAQFPSLKFLYIEYFI